MMMSAPAAHSSKKGSARTPRKRTPADEAADPTVEQYLQLQGAKEVQGLEDNAAALIRAVTAEYARRLQAVREDFALAQRADSNAMQ